MCGPSGGFQAEDGATDPNRPVRGIPDPTGQRSTSKSKSPDASGTRRNVFRIVEIGVDGDPTKAVVQAVDDTPEPTRGRLI
jgi:hypothetical protein